MNLQQFIQENVDLDNKEIVAALNEKVEVFSNPTPYTWSGINNALMLHGIDPSTVMQFNATILNMEGGAALNNCLSSGGFDCSNDINRMVIQKFIPTASTEEKVILNALLAIGVQYGTRAEKLGIALPSISEVTAARTELTIANNRTRFQNDVLNIWISDNTKSVDDLKSSLAAWG